MPSAGNPEDVARRYLGAVEAMRWQEVVGVVHPSATQAFRAYVEVILFPRADPAERTDPESPGPTVPRPDVLERLMGVQTVEEYLAMTDEQVLLRAFRVLEADSPGLINAWVARSTDVLGTVLEGDSLAHVVYRLQWELPGAPSDREILTLAPGPQGEWRVSASRELGSIRPALGAVLRRIGNGAR